MGHKIFVSYKYGDSNVKDIVKKPNYLCTARDYVDKLQNYIENSENIYKGEENDNDLSTLTEEAIWNILKEKIWDSTLTIVVISPCFNDGTGDKNQWIPWEISYSLKEETRKNKSGKTIKSFTNAILALVLPDKNASYSYYINENKCCLCNCKSYKTHMLFKILRENMFNLKKPKFYKCKNNDIVYQLDSSYIISVKWDDFILNPEIYIKKAFYLQNSIENYNIQKELI